MQSIKRMAHKCSIQYLSSEYNFTKWVVMCWAAPKVPLEGSLRVQGFYFRCGPVGPWLKVHLVLANAWCSSRNCYIVFWTLRTEPT